MKILVEQYFRYENNTTDVEIELPDTAVMTSCAWSEWARPLKRFKKEGKFDYTDEEYTKDYFIGFKMESCALAEQFAQEFSEKLMFGDAMAIKNAVLLSIKYADIQSPIRKVSFEELTKVFDFEDEYYVYSRERKLSQAEFDKIISGKLDENQIIDLIFEPEDYYKLVRVDRGGLYVQRVMNSYMDRPVDCIDYTTLPVGFVELERSGKHRHFHKGPEFRDTYIKRIHEIIGF